MNPADPKWEERTLQLRGESREEYIRYLIQEIDFHKSIILAWDKRSEELPGLADYIYQEIIEPERTELREYTEELRKVVGDG